MKTPLLTLSQRALILGDDPPSPAPSDKALPIGGAEILPQSRESRAAYWQGYADALTAADKMLEELGTKPGFRVLRRALRNLVDNPPGSTR